MSDKPPLEPRHVGYSSLDIRAGTPLPPRRNLDARVPLVSGGPGKALPNAVDSPASPPCSLGSVPPHLRPSSQDTEAVGGTGVCLGGGRRREGVLLSQEAARPLPPPSREDPPSAPAGRGRGRVIFTSLQAAGATGSECAARQMWGARQLGAATAGLAAGRGRGGGGRVCRRRIPGLRSPLCSPPTQPPF